MHWAYSVHSRLRPKSGTARVGNFPRAGMLWIDLAWKRGTGCQRRFASNLCAQRIFYYFSVLFISSLLVILSLWSCLIFLKKLKKCVITLCNNLSVIYFKFFFRLSKEPCYSFSVHSTAACPHPRIPSPAPSPIQPASQHLSPCAMPCVLVGVQELTQ